MNVSLCEYHYGSLLFWKYEYGSASTLGSLVSIDKELESKRCVDFICTKGSEIMLFSSDEYIAPRLDVNIAHGAVGSAHQICHGDRWASSIGKINGSVESRVGRRRAVQEGSSARNAAGASAGLLVELLPDPPGAIDHAVVEVEGLRTLAWGIHITKEYWKGFEWKGRRTGSPGEAKRSRPGSPPRA